MEGQTWGYRQGTEDHNCGLEKLHCERQPLGCVHSWNKVVEGSGMVEKSLDAAAQGCSLVTKAPGKLVGDCNGRGLHGGSLEVPQQDMAMLLLPADKKVITYYNK